ncbi:MAG: hypothetical protein LIQ30_12760, partial [Planctomycetes bacterium]|nr:hypothetical protein [Planctomycetota bacterium]
ACLHPEMLSKKPSPRLARTGKSIIEKYGRNSKLPVKFSFFSSRELLASSGIITSGERTGPEPLPGREQPAPAA